MFAGGRRRGISKQRPSRYELVPCRTGRDVCLTPPGQPTVAISIAPARCQVSRLDESGLHVPARSREGQPPEPVPAEQAMIRRVLKLRRRGRSYSAIAEHLRLESCPTKRGGRWGHSTVRKVIQGARRRREVVVPA